MLGDRIALSPSCPLPPVTNCTAIPRADDSPCGPPVLAPVAISW